MRGGSTIRVTSSSPAGPVEDSGWSVCVSGPLCEHTICLLYQIFVSPHTQHILLSAQNELLPPLTKIIPTHHSRLCLNVPFLTSVLRTLKSKVDFLVKDLIAAVLSFIEFNTLFNNISLWVFTCLIPVLC